MSDEKGKTLSRCQFIKNSLSLAGGLAIGAKSTFGAPAILTSREKSQSNINGVQIGAITYSYRSMPDQSAEAVLRNVVNSGISTIELMGDPAERYAGRPANPVDFRTFYGLMQKAENDNLNSDQQTQFDEMRSKLEAFGEKVAEWRSTVSMDKFVELREMYNEAGVSIFAWKPNAFGENNTDEEINYAFRAARALGAQACTTEHPGDDAQTKRLGDLAANHEIYISYHAHTQATPTFWDTALEQSEYNAINFDIGHYVAAGNPNPLEFIRANHDRIESMHMKDRTTPANDQKNLPWGEGDTPLRETLQLMQEENYAFPGTIELEYDIPEGSNAVKEVSRCLDFCRDVLDG